MWQLNLLLFTQALLGIMILVLIHKVGKIKAQADEITKEVKDYISFIIEDEVSCEADMPKEQKDKGAARSGDDIQSSLIQSVLGDIFP